MKEIQNKLYQSICCILPAACVILILVNHCHAIVPDAQTQAPAPAEAPAAPAVQAPATCVDGPSIAGISLAIAAPDASYIPMPDPMRAGVESSLPPTNRLLCGFACTSDPTGITSVSAQSIRPMEAATVTPEMFQQIVAQTKATMSGTTLEDAIKSVDKNNMVVGQPKPLGALFERTDTYSSAMLLAVNTPSGQLNLLIGTSLVRVKDKLVILSMTTPYADAKSVETMKTSLDAWTNAVLDSNK